MGLLAREQGLTLMELLMYVLIAGILTMAAVSGFNDLINRKQSDTYLNQLKSLIQQAKLKAIDAETDVTICPSTDQRNCNTSDWNQPLIMFLDIDDNQKIKNDDQLLEVLQATDKNDKLDYSGFGAQKYIQFKPDGYLSSQNGSFKYCYMVDGKPQLNGLVISRTGRVRKANNAELNTGKISSCKAL